VLERHAVASLDLAQLLLAHRGDVAALEHDAAGVRAAQPEMVLSSTLLPLPEPPTMPKISPGPTSKPTPVVDHLLAEAVDDVAHHDHGLGHQKSISRKKIANSASAKMTRKIDCTRRPS